MNSLTAGFPITLNPAIFSASDVARFWSKVDCAAGADACWPWTGGRDKNGYGRFHVGPKGRQRHLRSHRVALAIASGFVSLNALHSCDNPICCNPEHLFEGSHPQNVADRHRKGRDAAGARTGRRLHPESDPRGIQLTEALVAAIKTEVEVGKYGEIVRVSRKYGVSRWAVYQMLSGRTWRDVAARQIAEGEHA